MNSISALLLLFLSLCALSILAERITLESAPNTDPKAWTKESRLTPETTVKLTFALKQKNLDRLRSIFYSVSEPSSPSYTDYLTLDQIHELVSPKKEVVTKVKLWLIENGVSDIHHKLNSGFLSAYMPVQIAERLLECQFYYYSHFLGHRLARASGSYSLPAEIAELVDFVGGVKKFPIIYPTKKINRPSALYIDPSFIRKQYKINDVVGKSPLNSQSVPQFIGQYYSDSDLQEFYRLFFSQSVGQKIKVVGPNGSPPGAEASLDIQYITTVGANITTWFWSNPEVANQDPFLEWLAAVDQTPDAPILFSVSYGEDENGLTLDYVDRVEAEFQKQAVRGITVLFASGDSGVGGTDDNSCTQFVPEFPATSPSVTTVGGTTVGLFENVETAASLSGGGFSNFFPQPSYQTAFVKKYFTEAKNNLPSSSYYNASGRGYPDVAAFAEGFVIVIDRIPVPGVDGTSCATPTFAGVVSLLNDLRLQNGKRPLGFLNPLLYRLNQDHPDAFFDVVSGDNPGCDTNGFSAAPGWDPVTGLGSPIYQNLASYILDY